MGCLERPRRPHLSTRPFRNANADRSSAILTQTTTFGVTDIYFLACYYKARDRAKSAGSRELCGQIGRDRGLVTGDRDGEPSPA